MSLSSIRNRSDEDHNLSATKVRSEIEGLDMTVISEGPSLACHCEEPGSATWQSPIKKRGDYFASLAMTLRGYIRVQLWSSHEQHHSDFSVAVSRLTRNDIH